MKPEFNALGFMYNHNELHWLYEVLKLDIEHLKDKYPDSPKTKERCDIIEERLNRLSDVQSWLSELDKDYMAIKRVSSENSLNNLFLANKVTELETENTKLKLTIEAL